MAVEKSGLHTSLAITLALCCGFSVATVYYNQTMLPLMGLTFGVSAAHVGQIAMLTQLGYALGLLLFVPLGDRVTRRSLVLGMLSLNFCSLIASASAPSYEWLLLASVVLGLSAVSAQIIIPAATALALPEQRGSTLGMMVSGLSAGGLLARAVSGGISTWLGWRGMFLAAAGLNVLLFIAIALRMPATKPSSNLPYLELMRSMWALVRDHPTLRRSSLTGGLLFGALNVFWGSMASLLAQSPYGYSSGQAGLFGLSAIVGIVAASSLGRLAQHYGLRLSYLGSGAVLLTFIALYFCGALGAWWLILMCATALDIGNRANQLANQARILALAPEAVSRLNTVFMVTYFTGGALGSALGASAAALYGWPGLAAVGGMFAVAGLLSIGRGRAL
ncbi:MFS transporter [Pseudomonas sp. SZMC_28357]|uniref:MFS transporter n=1 Tax=Pseudomonas sp. SZMC_28357 TaxID=3074380 RepID=UPI0028718E4B|nr:MFS transporter [Pseudomonas sp. SZMC_28357]MDR9752694.1 MFS transporter [Pseudomonas sp. SZMC_28357]